MFFTKDKNEKVVDETLFQDEFDALEIELKDLDLHFKLGDSYQVHFHGKEEDKPKLEFADGLLKITQPNKYIHHHLIEVNIKTSKYGLTITVPRGGTSVLDKIQLADGSGDIDFDGIIATDLKMTVASGDILLNNCFFEMAKLKIASGDINLENIEVSTFKANTASGDIRMNNSKIWNLADLSAVSGELKVIATKFRTYHLKTVSGDNRLFGQRQTKTVNQGSGQEPILNLSTVSGDNIVE